MTRCRATTLVSLTVLVLGCGSHAASHGGTDGSASTTIDGAPTEGSVGDSSSGDVGTTETRASSAIARDIGAGRCFGINNHGQVVGVADDDTTFVVAADGTRTALAPPDSMTVVSGMAIDDAGRVGGYASTADGRHAVVFDAGAWSSVPQLGAGSAIVAASAGGLIGGASFTISGTLQGFLIVAGQPAAFNWPPGGTAVYAAASGGRAAGIVQAADGSTHAFVSKGSTVTDLGTLGGAKSAAFGMNENGDVVGNSETSGGQNHPFLVRASSTSMVDLGLPTGSIAADARGIDDHGDIIGQSTAPDGTSGAWLLRAGQTPVALQAIDADGQPFVSVHVTAISGAGLATGWGVVEPPTGPGARCLVWTVAGL